MEMWQFYGNSKLKFLKKQLFLGKIKFYKKNKKKSKKIDIFMKKKGGNFLNNNLINYYKLKLTIAD